jgi:hypothetical protein
MSGRQDNDVLRLDPGEGRGVAAGTSVGLGDAKDDPSLGGEKVASQLTLEEGTSDTTSKGIRLRRMGVDAQALGP